MSHYEPDGSGPPLRPDVTVGRRLREVAAEVPDRPALIEGSGAPDARRWTYAELLRDAERTAHVLLGHFEPGERVGVWAHNLPEWVLLECGAALAGITLVTINPSLQPSEAAYVLGQSRAAGVVLVPDVRGNPIAAHAEAIRPGLPELRHVLRLDQLDELMAAADERPLPTVGPTILSRCSTRAAPPAFRRGSCSAIAAWSTTRCCGSTAFECPMGRRL